MKQTVTLKELTAAIKFLNNRYGRGDVREVRRYADGRIEVTSRKQYGEDKFTARVQGRTVYTRGHQVTLTPKFLEIFG